MHNFEYFQENALFFVLECFFFSQLEFRKKTSQIETYRSNLDPLRLRMLAHHGPFLHIRGEVTSTLVNFSDDFSNELMMLVNILKFYENRRG